MHGLIIKTSSLGDVIHTFPAITDVGRECPGARFDWLVEDNFTQVPGWHPIVTEAVPVSLRRWRKHISRSLISTEITRFRRRLRERPYDMVIDAQGLLKSAVLGLIAKGPTHGFAWDSAREPVASLMYARRHHVPWGQHAITRLRQLFAQVFDYPMPTSTPDYGLDRARFVAQDVPAYVLFLHGTNWVSKLWPEAYWSRLAGIAVDSGYEVRLPWGNANERLRAERLATRFASGVRVLPRTDLAGLAAELVNARGAVGVDSGLVHVAAAFAVPTLTLYGATDARLTGTVGQKQTVLKAAFPCSPCLKRRCPLEDRGGVYPPCYEQLSADVVWSKLQQQMET